MDQIVALRSEALQLNETLRLAQLDKTEGEGQLQILKDKIAAKNLEGERQGFCFGFCSWSCCFNAWSCSLLRGSARQDMMLHAGAIVGVVVPFFLGIQGAEAWDVCPLGTSN